MAIRRPQTKRIRGRSPELKGLKATFKAVSRSLREVEQALGRLVALGRG
jgi:hypothetical protein